jgi:hypothetical protein
LDAAEGLTAQLADTVRALRGDYDFDETAHLASGAYAKELLVAAEAAGLAMFEEDERLLCYPSLVRILPGDAAIEVDKRRDRRLRPSVVIRHLHAFGRSRFSRPCSEPTIWWWAGRARRRTPWCGWSMSGPS